VDHLIAFDLHARALECAFPFPITHLDPEVVFIERLREWELASPVIVSPDAGGMKRAQRFASQLGFPMAAVAKTRPRPDMAQALCVLGDVRGHTCVIVDDMASTGRTLVSAADALLEAGATEVHAVFSHAVLAPEAMQRLADSRIKHLLTSDSIPMQLHPRLKVVSIDGALADAINRVCGGPKA
jgi:ribose-phosphate pyrophosphokinase